MFGVVFSTWSQKAAHDALRQVEEARGKMERVEEIRNLSRNRPPALDASLQSAVNWHLDRDNYVEAFRIVHGPWGVA